MASFDLLSRGLIICSCSNRCFDQVGKKEGGLLPVDAVQPPDAYLLSQLQSMDLPDGSVGILKEQAALRAKAREEKAEKQLLKGHLNA